MSGSAATSGPIRRSPLDSWYRSAGRGTRIVADMQLPEAWLSPQPKTAALGLADFSWRRRLGCKGPTAEAWLAAQGFRIPADANSATLDERGVLVARLATSEFLVEAVDGGGAAVAEARHGLAAALRPLTVYPVERQDFVVEVSGSPTNALLRQICNVDFEPLLGHAATTSALLLTSMAGVGVVAWPRAGAAGPAVTLWSDPSLAEYFWTTLLEVAADLKGGVAIALPGATGESQ
jgi:sarcosine oxidase gamma subunit